MDVLRPRWSNSLAAAGTVVAYAGLSLPLRRQRRERAAEDVAEAAAALRRAGLVANQNVGAVGDHVSLAFGDDDDVPQLPGDLLRDVGRLRRNIQTRREAF